jgi:ABC-type branched-subunit amino acid transport system ATPase component
VTAPLDITGVIAGYGKKTVVAGVDLAVRPGEIVTVLGHNGAGKTTLLRAVFGLITARAGRVMFDGRDITGRAPSANIADGVALVPQGHGIFRSLSVRQTLERGGFIAAEVGGDGAYHLAGSGVHVDEHEVGGELATARADFAGLVDRERSSVE